MDMVARRLREPESMFLFSRLLRHLCVCVCVCVCVCACVCVCVCVCVCANMDFASSFVFNMKIFPQYWNALYM